LENEKWGDAIPDITQYIIHLESQPINSNVQLELGRQYAHRGGCYIQAFLQKFGDNLLELDKFSSKIPILSDARIQQVQNRTVAICEENKPTDKSDIYSTKKKLILNNKDKINLKNGILDLAMGKSLSSEGHDYVERISRALLVFFEKNGL